jgi:hypothetical protein
MAADEGKRAVMGPAELVFRQDRVGLLGEIAVGVKQQLHALAQFFLAQEQGIESWF